MKVSHRRVFKKGNLMLISAFLQVHLLVINLVIFVSLRSGQSFTILTDGTMVAAGDKAGRTAGRAGILVWGGGCKG